MTDQQVYRRDHQEFAAALKLIHNFEDLPKLFEGCDPSAVATTIRQALSLPCLSHVSKQQKPLLEALKRWALAALDPTHGFWQLLATTTLSSPGTVHTFSASECRELLANAFLGNVMDTMAEDKDVRKRGGLVFWRMMRGADVVGVHKTASLLLYFYAGMELEGTDDDERVVEFHHLPGVPTFEFEAMARNHNEALVCRGGETNDNQEIFDSQHVRLHAGKMEDVASAEGFVNFANATFGYGKFTPSCTQEEILQVCCPEFNVGMLFFATMEDDEVVNVYNCRRFSSYTGYLATFRCTGALETPQIHHILTLDACTTNHFAKANVVRDTRKAYTSFAALLDYSRDHTRPNGSKRGSKRGNDDTISVSTGRWGCGAFGGTPSHKFLQQVLAARMAGVKIHFSTFGSASGCDAMLENLQSRSITVSEAWKLLSECPNRTIFEQKAGARKGPVGRKGKPPSQTGRKGGRQRRAGFSRKH